MLNDDTSCACSSFYKAWYVEHFLCVITYAYTLTNYFCVHVAGKIKKLRLRNRGTQLSLRSGSQSYCGFVSLRMKQKRMRTRFTLHCFIAFCRHISASLATRSMTLVSHSSIMDVSKSNIFHIIQFFWYLCASGTCMRRAIVNNLHFTWMFLVLKKSQTRVPQS